jgi:hypothetical protein
MLEQADCMRLGATSRHLRLQVLAHMQTLRVKARADSADSDVLVSVQGEGVIQYDAAKEVRAGRSRAPPRAARGTAGRPVWVRL